MLTASEPHMWHPSPSCARSFPELDPRLFSFNSKHGWCGGCLGTGVKLSGYQEPDYDKDRDASREQEDRRLDNFLDEQAEGDVTCPACSGRRLNREALAVRYRKRSIADAAAAMALVSRPPFIDPERSITSAKCTGTTTLGATSAPWRSSMT